MNELEPDPLMWWGYLHQNGSIQVKRWSGDHRDYTEDCEGNDFVQRVVRPFVADTREQATQIITQRLAGPVSELKSIGAFKLLPPAKDVCQTCAAKHLPEGPHNAQSLYYQYAFFADHQRWPNWMDAMSHCTEAVKEMWAKELTLMGVDVVGGKVNPGKQLEDYSQAQTARPVKPKSQ